MFPNQPTYRPGSAANGLEQSRCYQRVRVHAMTGLHLSKSPPEFVDYRALAELHKPRSREGTAIAVRELIRQGPCAAFLPKRNENLLFSQNEGGYVRASQLSRGLRAGMAAPLWVPFPKETGGKLR
jgi:hypothetical protein